MTNLLFTNNIIIKRSTRMMIFIAQKYSPTTSTISSSFMFKRFFPGGKFPTSGKDFRLPSALEAPKSPYLGTELPTGNPFIPLNSPTDLTFSQYSTPPSITTTTTTTAAQSSAPAVPKSPVPGIDKKALHHMENTIETAYEHRTHPAFLKQQVSTTTQQTATSPVTTTLSSKTAQTSDNLPPTLSPAVEIDQPYQDDVPQNPIPHPSPTLIGIQMSPNARDASGQPLKPHEAAGQHIFIGQKDTVAGTVVTDHILTSAKNNSITKQPNPKISDVNVKGQAKPQRVGEVETGRLLFENDEGITYVEVQKATDFLNNPQVKPKVDEIVKNSPPRHRTVRYDKDAPELYNEFGRPINEEDPDPQTKDVSTTTTSTQNNEDDTPEFTKPEEVD
jgi:hypothetical protein